MHQRFVITFTLVEAGNISQNLLNEVGKIVYSLYEEKEVIKKVYNNLMNSIQI